MKKISSFYEDNYKADISTYELEGGAKVLHIIKSDSEESHISLLFKAGSYFDKANGYPEGTSHLLEHITLGPNKYLKTIAEIGDFHDGTRERAEISDNGAVGAFSHKLFTYGHSSSFDRQVERLKYALDFPEQLIEQNLQKQKDIVLAEINSYSQKDRTDWYHFRKFLVSHMDEKLVPWTLGSKESLEKITTQSLVDFRQEMLIQENLIIAIQSPEELSKSQWKSLQGLMEFIPNGTKIETMEENAINKYDFSHFHQNDDEGVTVSITLMEALDFKVDYRKDAVDRILRSLINRVAYEEIREEKGLIYNFGNSSDSLTFKHRVYDVWSMCDKKNLLDTLDAIESMLYSELSGLIMSAKGEKYIENLISHTIFPPTSKYDINRAASKANPLLFGISEVVNHDLVLKELKTVTPKELNDRLQERLLLPPRIWTKSPYKAEEIKEIIEKSNLHKRWKDSKAVPV